MLRRYHIISVEDQRRAAERASGYRGASGKVVPITADAENKDRTRTVEPRG